jgi:hypothetical protein
LRLFDRIENAASLPENVQIIVLLAVRKPIIESGHHVALNSRAPEEAAVCLCVSPAVRFDVSAGINAGYGPRKHCCIKRPDSRRPALNARRTGEECRRNCISATHLKGCSEWNIISAPQKGLANLRHPSHQVCSPRVGAWSGDIVRGWYVCVCVALCAFVLSGCATTILNDAEQFPRWLDDNLFQGATFRLSGRRINAWVIGP